MKQLMMKILKAILVTMLAILVILLVFGLVLMVGWPWWSGGFILIGLGGIGLIIILVRKIWARKKEQRFIHQVIAQDDAFIKGMAAGDRASLRELQDRWKEAIDALRRSHLKKFGNPLYVLPWYMVIGESGSGKTTAIRSAKLSSPFAEVRRTSGISGTRNCDWWFFEQAIIIDTAGRYAIPVDEGRDKEEWQQFLAHLVKYRKQEPLNGLLISIAADKLITAGPDALEASGTSIRRRIDELMRVLGAKFPIYVLVTKCDLIQGMVGFCEQLGDQAHAQAMGALNRDLNQNALDFCSRSTTAIVNRLKDFRLLLVSRPESRAVRPQLLLFAEEFEKLGPGLEAFFKGAFQENPYQESALVRGLYFSSGRQEGTPYSHFLNALGLIGAQDVLPGTNKGLFLHDLFSKVLPRDRGLYAPTQRSLEWNRLTRHLGLTAWVALIIALCGLLSLSFVKNLKCLQDVSAAFAKPPLLQGEPVQDIVTLDRFRQAVVKVETRNRSWWMPHLGLTQCDLTEAQLKEKYCNQVLKGFLADFDQQMAERLTRFSGTLDQAHIARAAIHLVNRIHLLKARLSNPNDHSLAALTQPLFDAELTGAPPAEPVPDIQKKISQIYLHYLLWRTDTASLNKEMNSLQGWLKHILTAPGADLSWLIAWVNGQESLKPVRMSDFWGELEGESAGGTVAPAFCLEGRARIATLIKEIEQTLVDPLVIAEQKLVFENNYNQAYLDAWRDFGVNFKKGVEDLGGEQKVQQVAGRMGTDQGPFFSLLETMARELEPFSDNAQAPQWVKACLDLHSIRLQAAVVEKTGQGQAGGLLQKATDTVRSTIERAEKAVGRPAENALDSATRLQAAKACAAYRAALKEIQPAVASRSTAFQMATALYSEDPTTGASPFIKAYQALGQLQATLAAAGQPELPFLDTLLGGPIDFLHTYVLKQAACQIQAHWEKDVLVEVEEISDQVTLNQLLMGENGYAVKFLAGPAAPFIDRSLEKGYFPKTVFSKSLAFERDFFAFLTQGARASKPVLENYTVNIKAYPTSANKGAQIMPHATHLELQCSGGNQQLENFNFPVATEFNWSPQQCGDVHFSIDVGNLSLTKAYLGSQGFPMFLKDFETGQRVFFADEFPNEAPALKRMGIQFITVRYGLSGHLPVLKLLNLTSGKLPRVIAPCWD
jgi:type VI secretion system protein ImpL